MPIAVEWLDAHRFAVDIETEGMRLHWESRLSRRGSGSGDSTGRLVSPPPG